MLTVLTLFYRVCVCVCQSTASHQCQRHAGHHTSDHQPRGQDVHTSWNQHGCFLVRAPGYRVVRWSPTCSHFLSVLHCRNICFLSDPQQQLTSASMLTV